MKREKDKDSKNEYIVTVTTQFSIFMTDEEIDDEVDIPHELIASGCVDKLAGRDYEVNESEMD